MTNQEPDTPITTTRVTLVVSFVLMGIAILTAIPMYDAITNPQDGMGQMGRGLGGFFFLIFISLPTSLISLCCGLAIISKSKLAYITVIPTLVYTLMFILYFVYIWILSK